jgi:hypothetical protein
MGVKTCRELLLGEYGSELQTRINESDVTVGTSAVTLVSGNGARIWLSIQNAGSDTVYVSTLSSVAVGQGFIVPASGYPFFSWKDDMDFPTIALFAVSSGAGNNVHVVQQILTGSGE